LSHEHSSKLGQRLGKDIKAEGADKSLWKEVENGLGKTRGYR
jgi:hypothetical protein